MISATPNRGGENRRGLGLALLVLGLAAVGPVAAQAPAPPEPIQIFFPPIPPPIDAPHASAAGAAPEKWPAPPALAAYVSDPFYAPLSTRFAKNEIGDDLAFRLETYRASRSALLTELRARIDTLKEEEPAARQRALEEFASEQTPRIDALEKEAEMLREDLCQHGSGLTEYRRWRSTLSAMGKSPATPALQLEIIRMTVFYRDSLSMAQRRLLGGIAVKRADNLAPPPFAPGQSAGSMLYFSPHTARIFLPANLPAALADKIAGYIKERMSLEHELIEALYGRNVPSSDAARNAGMHTLAESQDPRIAALETTAEDIRRGLALLNDPAPPPELPELPADLTGRITAYRAEKLALNKALYARREQVMKDNPSADSTALGEKIRQAIAAFSEENAARLAALDKSKDAIRADVARMPGAGAGSADALLAKNSESLRRLQTAWDYRDYQTAVLQPGLSPAQRRLLFASALENLALPLPGGELPAGPP